MAQRRPGRLYGSDPRMADELHSGRLGGGGDVSDAELHGAVKAQYGSVIGRAREMGLFDERPWYDVGAYQFLVVVVILVAGCLIHRFSDK